MKKLLLYILLGLISPLKSISQNNLYPVFEIKYDSSYKQVLDNSYWQLLEDKEGKWTIEEVTSPALSDKFHDSLSKQPIDTTVHVYWFRYRIKNVMSTEASIALDSHSEQDDFYVLKKGKWEHFVTGHRYPWNKKDGFKAANYIPVILQPGEELTIYNRSYMDAKGIRNRLPVDFVDTQKEMEDEFYNYYNTGKSDYFSMNELLEAFIIGLLFISIFFNLFFYSIVREKVYLFFPLFLFFLGVNRLYNIASSYTWWVVPSMNKYVQYLGFAWAFILLFLVQFIRHFFNTFKKYPKWDKFILGLAILNVLLTLADFLFPTLPPGWGTVLMLLVISLLNGIPFCLLITLLLFVRKANRFQKLVIVGALPLMFFYGVLGTIILIPKLKILLPALSSWVSVNFRGVEVICIIWLVVLFSLVLFLRYNELRKENAKQALEKQRLEREKELERNQLIEQQKIDLEKQVIERTKELKLSLEDLKATQSQLIQSEKMASLGELTAGIAHEIQNPLNFVNNFSEVNKELIAEMNEEIQKGNFEEVKAIAKDVTENQEKINHHGKRADAIVKGMLQHSRSSNGVKEPADINTLCDEYLRLSYHGLRAKDKTFNATIKTDFDNSIGKINIIPQDIGRVIMNLLTNAFYVVNEKKQMNIPGYEPIVSVTTKRSLSLGEGRGEVQIKVTDNGNGIPQKVLDKIFQPFFTTKPTGQGTGLGLSLSYDIIKAHGGELKVETKEGEFAMFVITLPV
ncbi:MAG: ATP-binding protein [Ferruginibacter sp.]